MSSRDTETVEARLARLAGATSNLAPPPGLSERLAKRARNRGVAGVILPFGGRALVVAALAAAAAVALAFQGEQQLDSWTAAAEGTLWEP